MALRLDRLQRGDKIADDKGVVSFFLQALWQRVMEAIERADSTQQEQIDFLIAVQAAANAANAAALAADAAAAAAQAQADAAALAAADAATAAAAANTAIVGIETEITNLDTRLTALE